MTFLEKAMEIDNIAGRKMSVEDIIDYHCPSDYLLEDDGVCHAKDRNECKKCWNREMPNTEPSEKEFNIATQGYSKGYSNGEKDGYDKGLNDAWELARKIFTFNCNEMNNIFGFREKRYVFDELDVQEALAKLKAYEEAQIEVGDVVIHTVGTNLVLVTKTLDNNYFEGINEFGSVYSYRASDEWKKTGKHIDISSILEQIGE